MRIWLSRPHMSGHEEARVAEAFASNFVAPLGPQLSAFEARINEHLGGGLHCVGLSSGSAALHLALRIAGVGKGDTVWVSSMTFAGGVFPVIYEQATPVFLDLGPDHWTLDPDLVETALEQAAKEGTLPKALIPTDLYGQGVNRARFEGMAARFGIRLIVDSAESLGARDATGAPCGSAGDAAVLSFNGNKIITTSGGGMLVTRHADWAEQARFLATQARDPAPHYQHSTYGYNYRLSNICAAIGLGQMEVLEARVNARRAVNERYRAALARPGITFMPEPAGAHSTRWLTALTFDPDILGVTREDVRLALAAAEIEARPLWKPMHTQPLFEGSRYIGSGVDERLFANGLCLPSGSDLTQAEQDEVIERILALLPDSRG